MLNDKPCTNIMNLIDCYSYNYDLEVLILTGRYKGEDLEATKKWLYKNSFYYSEIFAREPNDYSKATLYKEKVYEELIKPNYDIVIVFEDNNDCVKMFRDKGLIVLQPQNSDY